MLFLSVNNPEERHGRRGRNKKGKATGIIGSLCIDAGREHAWNLLFG